MNIYQDSVSLDNYFQQCYIAPLKVNVEKQDRHFTEQAKRALLPHLPGKKDIIALTAITGNYEAFQFASEIKQFLEKENYNVGEVNQSVFNPPIKGQTIEPRNMGGIRIIVGKA